MALRISAFGQSDIGLKRELNEDSFVLCNERSLYVVCDGMGGHAAGEIASSKAAAIVGELLNGQQPAIQDALSTPGGYHKVLRIIEDSVEETCRQLYRLASAEPEYAGMGSTLTLLMVVGDKGLMAHVGDSRLYILRGGELHQLSDDHTVAAELKRMEHSDPGGRLVARYGHALTRSVGNQETVQVDTLLFDLLAGDTCLLCSDGLTRYFNGPEEIADFMGRDDLEVVPRQLVQLANDRGGGDNTTVIVLRVSRENADEVEQRGIQDQLDLLRSVFLFEGLPLNRLMRILDIAEVRQYATGEQVVGLERECRDLLVVLDGCFTAGGAGPTSRELKRGDVLAPEVLVRPRLSDVKVVALQPSRMMRIPRESLTQLSRRLPRLGNRVWFRLAKHLAAECDRARTESRRQGSVSDN